MTEASRRAARDEAVPASAPVLLRRRTPAERRAYLASKRDEMITKGIDPELFDLIAEATE